MSVFKYPPKKPLPLLADYDSFLYKYKILIRRARDAFLDDPHFHEHIAIWYNPTGEYNMYLNGNAVHCTPGTLLFMPPFAVHALDTRHTDMISSAIISVSLPANAFYNRIIPVYPISFDTVICGNKILPLCLKFSGEEKSELDSLFRFAHSEYSKKREMFRSKIFEAMDKVVEICAGYCDRTLPRTELAAAIKRTDNIQAVVRNAATNFHSPPSVEAAAKICGITPRGFTKLFKRTTNLAYCSFTAGIRVQNAIKFLKYTKKSMAEIAEECGYADNSHFTKAITAIYHSPPHILRREMIESRRLDIKSQILSEQLHGWESNLDSETKREHFNIALGKSDI